MAVNLHVAIYKAYHAQKNKTRPAMTGIGLSPGQPKVLRHLVQNDYCMQKEIAEALDIEPATVSRLLNNMEQNGLIRRSAPEERRRAASISITEKGRTAQAEWMQLCSEIEKQSMQGFTPEERDRFIGYLCRMYQNLTGKAIE